MKLLKLTQLLTAIVGITKADWQFRSRPDLAPPKLNITNPASHDVEKGFLIMAPFAGLLDITHSMHGPRVDADRTSSATTATSSGPVTDITPSGQPTSKPRAGKATTYCSRSKATTIPHMVMATDTLRPWTSNMRRFASCGRGTTS